MFPLEHRSRFAVWPRGNAEVMELREVVCTKCHTGHMVSIRQSPHRPDGHAKRKKCENCGRKTKHIETVLQVFVSPPR